VFCLLSAYLAWRSPSDPITPGFIACLAAGAPLVCLGAV